jgi:hypothetical protein
VADHRKDMNDMLAFIDRMLATTEVYFVESGDMTLETSDFWAAADFASASGSSVQRRTTVLSMASV